MPNSFLFTKEMFVQHRTNPISQDYEFYSKTLGQGAFGTVFQARKIKLDDAIQHLAEDQEGNQALKASMEAVDSEQTWAVKKINLSAKSLNKELLQNEIEIMSYLDHPLIVRLHQVYKNQKSLFLVQDILKGDSLYSILEDEVPLENRDLKFIFIQIIKAISYLHAQNVSHRDIKLENIMFLKNDGSFNLKLIDFGLAYCWQDDMKAQLRKSGENKKLIGTTDYMSPEMIAHNYDEKCDIWAAGVILYMLLSGQAPFGGDTDKEIMSNIKSLNYSLQVEGLKNVSQQAKDLISKILVPESERISIPQILQHPWIVSQSINEDSLSSVESEESPKAKKFPKCFSAQSIRKNSIISANQSLNSILKEFQNSSYDSQADQNLTLQKLEYFCNLSPINKLIALYSVFSQKQTSEVKYSQQFLKIDQDSDGTISLQDLLSYLKPQAHEEERIKELFNSMDMNQRGSISFSEYLACVFVWKKHALKSQEKSVSEGSTFAASDILNFEESDSDDSEERSQFSPSSKHGLSSLCSDDNSGIFDLNELNQLFNMLDKDEDGFISEKDFQTFFKNNGVLQENYAVVQQIKKLVSLIKAMRYQKVNRELPEQAIVIKQIGLPNSYKGDKDGGKLGVAGLPNTYKGDMDGGLILSKVQPLWVKGYRHGEGDTIRSTSKSSRKYNMSRKDEEDDRLSFQEFAAIFSGKKRQ